MTRTAATTSARPRAAHRPGRRLGPAAAVFAAVWLAGPFPAAAQDAASRPPPSPAEVLRDPATDRAARAAAADALLALGPEGEGPLRDALASPAPGGADRLAVLEALSRSPDPPDSLWPSVLAALAAMDDPAPALAAAGAYRTREAARLLGEHLDAQKPAAVRAAAAGALVRLTGRDDLGADPERWAAWAAQTESLSDDRWHRALARSLAGLADRLAGETQGLRQQLAQVYRKYYVQLPPAERPALLAELLVHESEDLRAVGFDLTRRELSSGQRLNGEVTAAALRLLEDRHPQARERAAVLVDLLAPADALAEVSVALERETDPRAAAAMLTAAARWKSPATWGSVVRWLGVRGPARTAAAQTALVLLRDGVAPAPPQRAAALEALRAEPIASLGPNSLRLLAAIGGEGDRAAVADLLRSAEPSARLSAAEALAPRPECLDRILDAAARDPALFAPAAGALAQHRPDAPGFWALAALPAPSEAQRTEGLLRLAGAMPVGELVAVASRVPDEEFRERLLAPLASATPALDPDTDAGLILLAETRLGLGLAEGALAALDALSTSPEPVGTDRVLSLRVAALLMLGRLEQAESMQAPAGAWLEGLRRCTRLAHAPAVVEAIRRLFDGTLDQEQRRLLDEAEAQIAATPPPPESADGSDGPPPAGGPG